MQEFFAAVPSGFFVEVGANHPTVGSQSWPFEQRGWKGIVIEPLPELADALRAQRRGSIVVEAACSSPEKRGRLTLHVPGVHNGFATLERNVDDLHFDYTREVEVAVTSLADVLAEHGVAHVDFMSIDTEGTELDVLAGLNLSRNRPSLILLEDKLTTLGKHRMMSASGYRLIRRTGLNNWYVPVESPGPSAGLAERLRLVRKLYLSHPFRRMKRWIKARRLGRAASAA